MSANEISISQVINLMLTFTVGKTYYVNHMNVTRGNETTPTYREPVGDLLLVGLDVDCQGRFFLSGQSADLN